MQVPRLSTGVSVWEQGYLTKSSFAQIAKPIHKWRGLISSVCSMFQTPPIKSWWRTHLKWLLICKYSAIARRYCQCKVNSFNFLQPGNSDCISGMTNSVIFWQVWKCGTFFCWTHNSANHASPWLPISLAQLSVSLSHLFSPASIPINSSRHSNDVPSTSANTLSGVAFSNMTVSNSRRTDSMSPRSYVSGQKIM